MADALLSPVVGGTFWVISGTLIAYSSKKIAEENDTSKIPLMGVVGAFVFAAQMINFTIPGTGSSGHIGGGLLLSIMLGPYRAFITLASVLTVQCLLFADGGVLALGSNIFNLAFFPAFIAHPLLYKKIAGLSGKSSRLIAGSITAAVAALLLGAFSVVLQTVLSGVTELSFGSFTLFMIPIHLAIGLVEGLVTWGIVQFVMQVEPSLLSSAPHARVPRVTAVFIVAALVTGGFLSWFASSHPDGLEWSVAHVTGTEELRGSLTKSGVFLSTIQDKISILPDYSFKVTEIRNDSEQMLSGNLGTSVAGLVGSSIVLIVASIVGLFIRSRVPRSDSRT